MGFGLLLSFRLSLLKHCHLLQQDLDTLLALSLEELELTL